MRHLQNTVLFLSVVLFSPCLGHAQGKVPPVKDPGEATTVESLRDPLHPGNSVYLNFSDTLGTVRQIVGSQIQYFHAWTESISTGVTVPFTLSENQATVAGAKTPRIGGGSFSRPAVDLLVRLTGDETSYINAGFDVGFPIQTDSAYQKSMFNAWMFNGSLTLHHAFHPFAVEVAISDMDSFNSTNPAGSSDFYLDSENTVSWNVQLFYYLKERWDLRITYFETAPAHVDAGINNGDDAFTLGTSLTQRKRYFGAGVDWAVQPDSILISLDGQYIQDAPPIIKYGTQWIGAVKWIF